MRMTFPDAKCRQLMGSHPSLIAAQLQPFPVLHTCLDTDWVYHLLKINSRITTLTKQRKIFKQRKLNFLGHNLVHINRNFVSRLVSTISEKIKNPTKHQQALYLHLVILLFFSKIGILRTSVFSFDDKTLTF